MTERNRERTPRRSKQITKSGSRARPREPVPPPSLTARPKTLPEELRDFEREDEEGLSVEPEQMASQFLEDAVEQGDELPRSLDRSEMGVNTASESDHALTGPNFEANQDVWENTVNLTSQEGADEALNELAPAPSAVELEMAAEEELGQDEELDLTESSLHEASLFDRETDELGEVESPRLTTDDTHTHGRRRGGHVRPRIRRSPGPR